MVDDNKLKDMMMTIGELMRRSMLKRPDSDAAFGEGAMMMYLFRHGSATAGDLSDFLRVGSGRVANLLKTSEKKGIIKRGRDETDGRKVIVILTEKGREMHKKRTAELKNEFKKSMSVLTDDEFDALLSIYKKLLGAKKDV